jgi:PAS domain S-box-containing protein
VKVGSILELMSVNMIRRVSDIEFRINRMYLKYMLITAFSLAAATTEATPFAIALNSQTAIGSGHNYLLSGVILTLSIICLIVFFILMKLKNSNNRLIEKNKEILLKNVELEKMNNELNKQKDLIAKDHTESDKFYEILVKSADDGFAFYDKDWNLKYGNSSFYSMLGIEKESFNSFDIQSRYHPDDKDFQTKLRQSLASNGFFDGELRVLHKDGNYINLSTRSVVARYENGEIFGALTVSRDITRLKQVHEELIKANVEAEASNRLKSSFLANISHEIRTPLNSVVGFSNLLLSDNLTKASREEYIEHINYNSEKLLQIIGDIIDRSRLESSQIEITYEETSLNAIVNEIIDDARQVIRRNEKPIMLNVKNHFGDNGDLIFTDRIWLKRVLNHLMDNAVKFTLDGSIEFSYLKENENIVFKIKDTGIGIKKENLSRIFEEFRQEIDGHHRPFEGLGIGLTLAKEVVERMGGRIFVQSEKGFGSEFSFSIPYRPAGTKKTKLISGTTDQFQMAIDWSMRKCLLVDDNKDVLLYLNRILLDTGITILKARSGIDAIEIIKNNSDLDVVLLDMQMPEMNGIEAAREIRKIRNNLPIIAQTAFVFEDEKDIILEAGCDACLLKPIRKDHLITVMTSFIKSS